MDSKDTWDWKIKKQPALQREFFSLTIIVIGYGQLHRIQTGFIKYADFITCFEIRNEWLSEENRRLVHCLKNGLEFVMLWTRDEQELFCSNLSGD